MVVRILGGSNVDVKRLLSSALKLYRKAPMPPNFYLLYDLLYELDRTDIVIKPSSSGGIQSYVLAWRHSRGCSVHLPSKEGLELLGGLSLDSSKPVVVELYERGEELIEAVSSHLSSLGFSSVETAWFSDMVCDEDSFRPSLNESMAVRLGRGHADAFLDYYRDKDSQVSAEEVADKLSRRTYYGVFADKKLVSAGAICAKLPRLGVICDVYTRPTHRRRGYATAVVSAATRKVVSSGARAFLSVNRENEEAINIYLRLGYQLYRTRPWIIAKP